MKFLTLMKCAIGFAILAAVVPSSVGNAQDLFLQKELGGFGNVPQDGEVVTFESDFEMKTGTRMGVLNVHATIAPGWHVFSVTQPKGGPIRSTIVLNESDQYRLVSKFKPDEEPHIKKQTIMEEITISEEHEFLVTWSATIELSEGVDPEDLVIKAIYNGQTCESKDGGVCQPISNVGLEAEFDGFDDELKISTPPPIVKIDDFFPENSHIKFNARIFRAVGIDEAIRPGDTVRLEVTATPLEGFHVYAYGTLEEKTVYTPTIFAFTKTNGWKVDGPAISETPHPDNSLGEDQMVYWHHDPVTWTFEIQIPTTVEADTTHAFEGMIGFQTCKDGCDLPDGLTFKANIALGSASVVALDFEKTDHRSIEKAVKSGAIAKGYPKGGYEHELPKAEIAEDVQETKRPILQLAEDTPERIAEMATFYNADEKIKYLNFDEMDDNPIGSGGTSSADQTTFWKAILWIFLGGMILNLMPCVFPVLGLKVMGFVKQAGGDPAKIRNHGIAFAFGLVVSMWVLAGSILILKSTLGEKINWGSQMGNPYFVVSMILLLFVLGLNMAGVFEIGTSLSSVGGSLQGKKGYTSSFLSGILTTLIATPCSGPFLGAAMGYTLAQPALIAMFLFTVFALGIAAPYLLLSCFPSLIGKLPKPGPWMDTFKVTMAFALFGTVAFFMQAFGGQTGAGGLSWLIMALVVVALALFFYGKWSESHHKPMKRWVFGHAMPAIIAGIGVWMCFDAASQQSNALAVHNNGELTWHPGRVEYSIATNQRIIWVDYTADW